MKKALLALVGITVLFAATSCGNALSSAEKPVAKKMSAALVKETGGILSKKQADCTSKEFVSSEGLAKLKKAKVIVSKTGAYNANGANVTKTTSAAYSAALIKCVSEKTAEKGFLKNVTAAFTASSQGVLAASDVTCFAKKFVETVGVKDLLAAQIVTDAGTFNQTGATLTASTSGKYADAFLGCVDYQKVQAEAVAKSNPLVDPVKLAACLSTSMPTSYVRQLIVANQTQSSEAATLNSDSNAKATACTKAATKATPKKSKKKK
ncbi:MAG: hypothetical protein JWP74_1604 [Marmoricola sp.]|nr:hypothetical protein [Marmoricola sp.]